MPTGEEFCAPSVTKAELVYIVTVILANLKPTDDHTKIEMVELRHYMNQIRDKVVLAAHAGELKEPSSRTPANKEDNANERLPSMKELKEKFPNLTEVEIAEIIVNAKAEMDAKSQDDGDDEDVRQYDLGEGCGDEKSDPSKFILTPSANPMQSQSVKFASLLGS